MRSSGSSASDSARAIHRKCSVVITMRQSCPPLSDVMVIHGSSALTFRPSGPIAVSTIHAGGRLGFSGNDFVDDGIPAYGAAGLNGYLDTAEYECADAVILSSIGARCGKCFLVGGTWTSLANTQVILPDPNRVDARFLWYQLNDERRWHRSGSAQPFIKPSDVKAHRVHLPSLPEQRRIATILDHADALRAKRRQVLARLNTLTQSIFHDMFGDIREHLSFGASVEEFRYGTSNKSGQSGRPTLRIPNVIGGALITEEITTVDVPNAELERLRLQQGDLLIVRSNGNPDNVGRCAVFDSSAERYSGCQDHVQESPTVAAQDDLGAGGRVRSARSLPDRSAYVVIGTNQSRLLTGPVTRAIL